MPSVYEFDSNRQMFITLKDKNGNQYRVQAAAEGGFIITKTGAHLVDAITVHPVCANEIRIS